MNKNSKKEIIADEQETKICSPVISLDTEYKYYKYVNDVLLKTCFDLLNDKDDYDKLKNYLKILLNSLSEPIIKTEYKSDYENFVLNCIKSGILSEKDSKMIIKNINDNIPPIVSIEINDDEKIIDDIIQELKIDADKNKLINILRERSLRCLIK